MFASLARLFKKPPPAPRWVEVAQLRQQLDSGAAPLVLDVRGPDEFAGPLGHIDGALNIPLPELGGRGGEIAADRPVVCVCLTDKRSSAAAVQLIGAGAVDVTVLRGGMKAWREAGL
jgi:rhodanese-related sulfurtransferase